MRNDETHLIGTLHIRRTSQYYGKWRAVSVLADGLKIAKIRDGETIVHRLPVGDHTIQTQMDWEKSNLLHVRIESGKDTWLETGCPLTGWKVLLVTFYRDHLYLKQVSA